MPPHLSFGPVEDLELELDVGHRSDENPEAAALLPAVEDLHRHLRAFAREGRKDPGLVGDRGARGFGPGGIRAGAPAQARFEAAAEKRQRLAGETAPEEASILTQVDDVGVPRVEGHVG